MALLDFLKNKDQKEKAQKNAAVKKPVKASVTKKAEKKEEAVTAPKAPKGSNKGKGFSYSVIKEPHISEKSNNLTAQNKYTFRVHQDTNKPEIKKSVEGIYGVDVVKVAIIAIPKKKRRLGRTEGFRKAFTKAVVTIKAGQTIEIF